jgi:PAS domain S-box-containing protein
MPPGERPAAADIHALKLEAILASAAAGIITIDSRGRIETVNPWVERQFGYAGEELVGRNISMLMPEPYSSQHDEYLRKYLATGHRRIIGIGREVAGLRKDGTTFAMHLSVGEFAIGGEKYFAGIILDLTAQRDAEQRLEREQALFMSIFENLPDPLVVTNAAGAIRLVNAAFAKVFGYSVTEMLGESVGRLCDDEASARLLLAGQSEGAHPSTGTSGVRYRRKNGEAFPSETIHTGFYDRAGARLGWMVLIHDATAERQQEAVLLQAQRMEAIGQLTGGVAHDFNNLLTVILGNIELLEGRLGDELSRSLAGEAREAAEMGARLTDRLLTFARKRRLETRRIELNEFVLGMSELLRRTIGAAIDLSTSLAADLWPTVVDPGQVENAVLNLAINARDAMPDGGRLLIETYNESLDREAVALMPGLAPGDYVVLSVSDTGHGMTPEVEERAFEPFFTTKSAGKGSGLGLATIYGFARQSGGAVTLYSELGKGTTVRLYLPRHHVASSAPAPQEEEQGTCAGRGETVLVVEDDERVRRLTANRLGALGYAVLEASNGAEALAAMEQSAAIDIVFTDLVMPGGMSGLDLAERIARQHPAMRVVLTSGYSEELVGGGRVAQLGLRVLRKPYRQADLARVLREIMDAPPRR